MVTGATQPRIQATVEQATANHRDSPVEPGAKEPLEQAWPLTHRAGVAGLPVMIRAPVCVALVITLYGLWIVCHSGVGVCGFVTQLKLSACLLTPWGR